MPTGTLTPTPFQTVLDDDGVSLSGSLVYTYLAGTTTAATTYTDSALSVANANPIVADSAGRFVAFLTPGTSYKFLYKTAAAVTIRTVDNISAVPASASSVDLDGIAGEALTAGQTVYLSDGSGSKTSGRWYLADADLTYASSEAAKTGMVIADIASGSTGTIRTDGVVTGLSGLTAGTSYYVSATAGTLTSTAPTLRRLIGIANTTTSLVLIPTAPIPANTSTITTTGTQTALAIPFSDGPLTIFANNATLLTLQGVLAGKDGQTLTIYSIGAGQVDLANQNGSASAADRVINGVTGTISLAAGSGRAVLQYDLTTARWRVREHEQGAWITPTFAAGTYTGVGGGSWTLAAGDVTTQAYRLSGRTLQVMWTLVTTTVAGTVGNLSISNAAWGGLTATKAASARHAYSDNGGAEVLGSVSVTAAATVILINRIAGANWTAATDATSTTGQITFEVS